MRMINDEITPREWAEWEHDQKVWEASAAHQIKLKEMELEVLRLETKWAQWLRLPLVIITLPLRILLVIPLSIYAATKQEVPEQYWKFLK